MRRTAKEKRAEVDPFLPAGSDFYTLRQTVN